MLLSFQLTTSRRGRQYSCSKQANTAKFQLTTSRRGRQKLTESFSRSIHFNSRPREEVDYITGRFIPKRSAFQLTTSRRGRRQNADGKQHIWHISTHDLAKRSTCWFLVNLIAVILISTHDLAKRSTYPHRRHLLYRHHFNSRPREEVDRICLSCNRKRRISTHDLAKRSTFPPLT